MGIINILTNVSLPQSCRDTWKWNLDDNGVFKVKTLTTLIEDCITHVGNSSQETVWNKLVPRKVNVFIWRDLKGDYQ